MDRCWARPSRCYCRVPALPEGWYLAVFGFAAVAMMIWLPGGLLVTGSAVCCARPGERQKQELRELEERAAGTPGKGTVEAA